MNLKLFRVRIDSYGSVHQEGDQQELSTFLDSVKVKKTATQFVIGQPDFWSVLVFYEDKTSAVAVQEIMTEIQLTEEEQQLFNALKLWRKDRAKEVSVPEYLICHNTDLLTVAKLKPLTLEQLGHIKGFGSQKVAKYGDDVIAIVNAF